MWFAFNYWYYDLWIQPLFRVLNTHQVVICFQLLVLRSLNTTPILINDNVNGCDLLSITGITIFEYNIIKFRKQTKIVVICFQLLVLRSLNTTMNIGDTKALMLWFAFNYWYYDLWIQQNILINTLYFVVICFQLLVLRSLNTTKAD